MRKKQNWQLALESRHSDLPSLFFILISLCVMLMLTHILHFVYNICIALDHLIVLNLLFYFIYFSHKRGLVKSARQGPRELPVLLFSETGLSYGFFIFSRTNLPETSSNFRYHFPRIIEIIRRITIKIKKKPKKRIQQTVFTSSFEKRELKGRLNQQISVAIPHFTETAQTFFLFLSEIRPRPFIRFFFLSSFLNRITSKSLSWN